MTSGSLLVSQLWSIQFQLLTCRECLDSTDDVYTLALYERRSGHLTSEEDIEEISNVMADADEPARALQDAFGALKPPDISRKITACVACRKQKVRRSILFATAQI